MTRKADAALQPTGLVVLTGASTVSRSVRQSLFLLAAHGSLVPGTGEIEVIAPDQPQRPMLRSAVNEVERELTSRYPGVEVMRRPNDRGSDRERSGWLEVPAPAGTERFGEILVPAWWSRSTRRCLVTSVTRRTTPRLSPMLVLAGLAHSRQRLAARLHRNRVALAAELAAPWRVDLCLIVASQPPHRIVAATHDLIAAELTWLALTAGDAVDEEVGPWEDPAVQRATQLGMGILGPHQVSIRSAGDASAPALTGQLATRLGVTSDHSAAGLRSVPYATQ
jgi:hypothetical protein